MNDPQPEGHMASHIERRKFLATHGGRAATKPVSEMLKTKVYAGTRQMPNETHLKRLISDAVFEAHNTHGGQNAGDRLHISREDSRIIASAVFDVLRRANVLLIDQPGQPNPETA